MTTILLNLLFSAAAMLIPVESKWVLVNITPDKKTAAYVDANSVKVVPSSSGAENILLVADALLTEKPNTKYEIKIAITLGTCAAGSGQIILVEKKSKKGQTVDWNGHGTRLIDTTGAFVCSVGAKQIEKQINKNPNEKYI